MRNWAGQEIKPGVTVWRGARDGNTSSFKIGTVVGVNEDKGVAKVNWLFEEVWNYWPEQYLNKREYENLIRVQRMDSTGSPSIDTLAVIDIDLEELGRHADEWQRLEYKAKKLSGRFT